MKKLTSLLLVTCLTATAFAQQAFEVITKKPTPGSVVTVEYMPRNTALQGVKDFDATAYLFEGAGLPRAVEIPLKQQGGLFRGSVKTTDSTRAVFFAFSKEDKRDNNNDEGYYTALYTKTGKEVIGAQSAIASAYSNYGGIWGLKSNATKAAGSHQQEWANPEAKQKLATDYLQYLSQSKAEGDKELFKAELAKRLERKDLSESDLQMVRNYYVRILQDKEKADAVFARVKEQYPAGTWKREEMLRRLGAAPAEDKQAKYDSLFSMLNLTKKQDAEFADRIYSQMATYYDSRKEYSKAAEYFAKVQNNAMAAGSQNNLAWKLAGEGINNKPVDVDAGLLLSKQSLDAVVREKKEMKGKPPYMTARQYAQNMDNTYHTYADTYATLLYHKSDFQQAYALEKAAVESFKRKDISMNEAYASLLEKVKGPKLAQAELEAFLESGKYTPAMKEQLKKIYTAGGKTDVEWNAYVGAIEDRAYNKLKAELAKQMINLPAPQFALKDMDGKQVSLASLKGKIVVVDFWATWCGPCIASFPGMQMALNKFKNHPDVAFLFIDTWENDSNRTQKVTDFIAKNKYTFHVLYDDPKAAEGNEFVVVKDFNVEGIPTKFVIDRNSNIRFKAVGFSGSTEGIVQELTAMIDMAATESGEPLKKGF